jgi:hypothetical protein
MTRVTNVEFSILFLNVSFGWPGQLIELLSNTHTVAKSSLAREVGTFLDWAELWVRRPVRWAQYSGGQTSKLGRILRWAEIRGGHNFKVGEFQSGQRLLLAKFRWAESFEGDPRPSSFVFSDDPIPHKPSAVACFTLPRSHEAQAPLYSPLINFPALVVACNPIPVITIIVSPLLSHIQCQVLALLGGKPL